MTDSIEQDNNDGGQQQAGVLTLVNAASQRLTVFLEPWGSCHRLPAGGRMRLATLHSQGGLAIDEVVVGELQITLYAAPGATIERTDPTVRADRSAP